MLSDQSTEREWFKPEFLLSGQIEQSLCLCGQSTMCTGFVCLRCSCPKANTCERHLVGGSDRCMCTCLPTQVNCTALYGAKTPRRGRFGPLLVAETIHCLRFFWWILTHLSRKLCNAFLELLQCFQAPNPFTQLHHMHFHKHFGTCIPDSHKSSLAWLSFHVTNKPCSCEVLRYLNPNVNNAPPLNGFYSYSPRPYASIYLFAVILTPPQWIWMNFACS